MNVANKLSIFRVILIPFFLFFLLANPFAYSNWVAVFIFTVAAITDAIDGNLARKRNLITNLGKFLDPVADKLLVCSALIALIQLEAIPAIAVIIIIAREFIITFFRTVAASAGSVIAADKWGKIKTTFQITMIIYLMVFLEIFDFVLNILPFLTAPFFHYLGIVLIWITVFITAYSAFNYIHKNIQVFKEIN
ncbi:MAG: CDP-diacylglycerol--glycerol-3-phosphate 3-phosphatidyltransferase [Defluviitaleaceae bacterium]|nr:CDP-diacylglycerol--glycerol-3-phosphate 3-phosphatidyltransferase [Defluviitaleaceae bacterium]